MNHPLSGVRSDDRTPPRTGDGFSELGLCDQLAATVSQAGFQTPTPIQRLAIPHVLAGEDLLGCAQTGTGKTAAFALPILQRLWTNPADVRREPRVLVLSPTRELASQIADSFAKFGGPQTRPVVIFGGVGKGPQIDALRRGAEILIATPGRLLDLMGDRAVRLEHVEIFVLDEADRMLDMGFLHDVRKIEKAVAAQRQTLLFSATMPAPIAKLATSIQRNAKRVNADRVSSTGAPIEQLVYEVADRRQKVDLLLSVLQRPEVERALVFARTKHGANRLAKQLDKAGVATAAIHGNKSQSARELALRQFRAGELRVVVATDIAARGIDIDDLSHVVNFDLPNEPESYVHRIGRTGRAGRSGIALSFCADDERSYLQAIERLIRMRITRGVVPNIRSSYSDERAVPSDDSAPRPQGRPARGRPAQGRPAQGRPAQGRPAQGRPAQGRPAQGRPAQQANPPLRRRPSSQSSPEHAANDESNEPRPRWRRRRRRATTSTSRTTN